MSKNHVEFFVAGLFVFAAGLLVGFHVNTLPDNTAQFGSVGSAAIRPAKSTAQQSPSQLTAPAPTAMSQSIPMSDTSTISPSGVNTSANSNLGNQIKNLTGLKMGDESLLVRELQNRLGARGFFEGKATGYFGQKTSQAVMAFQKKHILPSANVVSQQTAQSLLSNQLSSDMCAGTSAAAAGDTGNWPPNFPPHAPGDVVPPLPPRDTHPPHNAPPGDPSRNICTDFANRMCNAYRTLFPNVNCSMLSTGIHAVNLIRFTDSNGVRQVCVVEPQNNQYMCMTEAEWNQLSHGWQDWVKNTFCSFYPPGTCSDPDQDPYLIPTPLRDCPADAPTGGYSSSCPAGLNTMCVDQHGTAYDLFCSGPNICPDSDPQGPNDQLVPLWKHKRLICYYAEPMFVPQDNQ